MKNKRIDTKFTFTGFNPFTGKTVTQDNAVVFKASDNALLDTLDFYRKRCQELGADDLQIRGIGALMDRVLKWQEDHPHLCKVADTTPDEEAGYIAPLDGCGYKASDE